MIFSKFAFVTAFLALLLSAVFALAYSAKDESMELFFHMRRNHADAKIESEFNAVSTPGNPKFRQFLDAAGLKELVGASPATIKEVRKYLIAKDGAGCSKVELFTTEDIMSCTLPTESPLYAKIKALFTEEQNPRVMATSALPESIRGYLVRHALAYRQVAGLKNNNKLAQPNLKQAGMSQDPSTINRRYGVPSSFPKMSDSFVAGVGEFEGEYFRPSDMQTFASRYQAGKTENITVMGQNVPSGADAVEGTLDLQYMGSITLGKQKLAWLEGSQKPGMPGDIDFSRWIHDVTTQQPDVKVVSISWGFGVYREAMDMANMFVDNDAFRKAGLTGLSVLSASGDSGPGVRNGIFKCDHFMPSWPASSQYLTSVGATYANSEEESEVSVKWSGGGFNNQLDQPEWQKAAVDKYIRTAKNMPKASFYNASGRAYPDVSALGTNFQIYVNGRWMPVSGTSAASPTFSGVIAAVVSERLAEGKSALGFLNPSLYKMGKVGQDVVEGQTEDMNCLPFLPIKGFPAAIGWDACTGLGTPNYNTLRSGLNSIQ